MARLTKADLVTRARHLLDDIESVERDGLVLVRVGTGGVLPDGTTNHPPLDFTAHPESVEATAPEDARETSLHPGQHEFTTVCRFCGDPGILHVSVITPYERVSITDPRALTPEATAPERTRYPRLGGRDNGWRGDLPGRFDGPDCGVDDCAREVGHIGDHRLLPEATAPDIDSLPLNGDARVECVCGRSVEPENWSNHLLRQSNGPHRLRTPEATAPGDARE